MAVVTGLTADRMLLIEQSSIIAARRDGDNVVLITKGNVEYDLGDFKGAKGDKGDVGVESIDVAYAVSTSGTEHPDDSTFGSDVPVSTPGSYIWSRTRFVDTEGNIAASIYSPMRQGQNGTINSVNGKTGGDITLTAADISGAGVPVGTSLDFRGDTAPTGFLVEDGSAVSRTTYSDLFGVIGTKYGSGNGTTTFNLPDSRGYVNVGVKIDDPDIDTVGKTFGTKLHLLTASQIPTLVAASAGAHAHTTTVSFVGSHNHGGATGSTRPDVLASNTDTANMPASVATLRVASSTGGLSKALSQSDHTHTIASDGGHTHTVTVNSGGDHTHTVNPGTTAAHPNMQPSLVALKIIKF